MGGRRRSSSGDLPNDDCTSQQVDCRLPSAADLKAIEVQDELLDAVVAFEPARRGFMSPGPRTGGALLGQQKTL
jgi:CxxC motif-containing protein (DUF1111 family)